MKLAIVIYFCLMINTGVLSKNAKIIGGTYTSIRNYPHMVMIREFESQEHLCGGSIISKWNILTSAHCLYGLKGNYSNVKVYTGTSTSFSTMGPRFSINTVYFHPEYTHGITGEGVLNHDICVIELNRAINFNEYQNKIKLTTKNIRVGEFAILAGWGVTSPQSTEISEKLRHVSMMVYDYSDCLDFISNSMVIFDDQFCTFNTAGYGICDGDSGGSIIQNGVLVGIITDTFECAKGLPDIHTKVYKYLDFIDEFMEV